MVKEQPPAQAITGPPLVGRDRQLAEFEQHLVRRDPPLVVLAGEPDIGKTRLLQETTRQATDLGYIVIEGR